jgi:hypothetical protein
MRFHHSPYFHDLALSNVYQMKYQLNSCHFKDTAQIQVASKTVLQEVSHTHTVTSENVSINCRNAASSVQLLEDNTRRHVCLMAS